MPICSPRRVITRLHGSRAAPHSQLPPRLPPLKRTAPCRNIIRFDGFGMRKPQEIRTAFYLMEHLPGGSLKGRFQPDQGSSVNRAQFSSMDALRWSIQLCSAIAHMHGLDAPIVHRDIKLENILLTTQSTASANVKLADFGLAVQLEHRQKYSQDDALQQLNEHLRTGATLPANKCPCMHLRCALHGSGGDLLSPCRGWVCACRLGSLMFGALVDDHDRTTIHAEASGPIGTSDLENWYHLTGQSGSLLYMAPEVFLNLPYNEKADVFSLGVVIYELFVGMQMADLVLKHRTWAEAKEFARTVARGHRVKLNALPPDQASLIRACWQQVLHPQLRGSPYDCNR